jgi:hypothetical protein
MAIAKSVVRRLPRIVMPPRSRRRARCFHGITLSPDEHTALLDEHHPQIRGHIAPTSAVSGSLAARLARINRVFTPRPGHHLLALLELCEWLCYAAKA